MIQYCVRIAESMLCVVTCKVLPVNAKKIVIILFVSSFNQSFRYWFVAFWNSPIGWWCMTRYWFVIDWLIDWLIDHQLIDWLIVDSYILCVYELILCCLLALTVNLSAEMLWSTFGGDGVLEADVCAVTNLCIITDVCLKKKQLAEFWHETWKIGIG